MHDGGLTLWVDDVTQQSLTGIDNDTRRIDLVRLGAVSGVDPGTNGSYYFDSFESRQLNGYIGPDRSETGITYRYDPLNRLTDAIYNDGSFFRYTYDSNGNRLTEETPLGVITSTYDVANRLQQMGELPYTWGDNGNLLSDGVYTYTYSHANRLVGVSGMESGPVSYAYSGLGDRLQQTVNGNTTYFTMDLTRGLTQVLADGSYTYLYGAGRIAQANSQGMQYFIGDALGSVRQMADASGAVVFAQSYEPYGKRFNSNGVIGKEGLPTAYGYTGEMQEAYGTERVYLRARWYAPGTGRFMSRDTWGGNYKQPTSYNKWLYTDANPINFVDPTGHISEKEAYEADKIVEFLSRTYNVYIPKDWGYQDAFNPYNRIMNKCSWNDGAWRNLKELKLVHEAVTRTAENMNGFQKFRSAIGPFVIERQNPGPPQETASARPYLVTLTNYHFDQWDEYVVFNVVHEMGHLWDNQTFGALHRGLQHTVGTESCINGGAGGRSACWYDKNAGIEDPPGNPVLKDNYAAKSVQEDWADSFATYIYPHYFAPLQYNLLGPIRRAYVEQAINAIP